MCDLDKAQEAIEFAEQLLVDNARASLQTRQFAPKGICYNCSEIVGKEQIYCDSDCADDHKKRINLKKGVRL